MWKQSKRISMILAVATALQTVQPVVITYGHERVNAHNHTLGKGSISGRITFDYPIHYSTVKAQNLQVTVLSGEEVLLTVQMGEEVKVETYGADYDVKVVPLNREGTELTTEEVIGSYFFESQGLNKGEYTLKYEGEGYVTYQTEPILIEDYSKNIQVHTGQETFSYGDLNGDNKVTEDELVFLEEAIQGNDVIADLNGDGKVDIIDLKWNTRGEFVTETKSNTCTSSSHGKSSIGSTRIICKI